MVKGFWDDIAFFSSMVMKYWQAYLTGGIFAVFVLIYEHQSG